MFNAENKIQEVEDYKLYRPSSKKVRNGFLKLLVGLLIYMAVINIPFINQYENLTSGQLLLRPFLILSYNIIAWMVIF